MNWPLLPLAWQAPVIATLCVAAALAGCTINPVAVDNAVLQPNQGLLVMQIKSNAFAKINFDDYDPNYGFAAQMKHELLTGSKGYVVADARQKKYIVMPVNAGDYMWTNFEAYPKATHLEKTNKFKIVANTITYIGQLDIFIADMRFTLHVSDQSADMRSNLAANFPGYLKTMPMVTELADVHLTPR